MPQRGGWVGTPGARREASCAGWGDKQHSLVVYVGFHSWMLFTARTIYIMAGSHAHRPRKEARVRSIWAQERKRKPKKKKKPGSHAVPNAPPSPVHTRDSSGA